jgi:uncharacterized protein
MDSAIAQYRRLRDRIDERVASLLTMHQREINCRPGCHGCCTNLTVFPVEYWSIVREMREDVVKDLPFDPAAPCGFLNEGMCTIYKYRPLICRTHGLPIAFSNDEMQPPQCTVSFCPRNFTQTTEEDFSFGPANTLDVDGMNEELRAINIQYLCESAEERQRAKGRIPLRQVVEDIKRI